MWKVLRSYLFWTYPRGSFHYDVMVTLILIFLFVSPHLIDFGDKPVYSAAVHGSEVVVREDGHAGQSSRFVFTVQADQMRGAATDAERRTAILRLIEPISGEVTIDHYEPVKDAHGKVVAYNAWVLR